VCCDHRGLYGSKSNLPYDEVTALCGLPERGSLFSNAREEVIMIAFEQIQAASEAIAKAFQPEQIILFGSYAYGTPTPDSDVDLLVVMPFEGHEAHQALAIRQQVPLSFPADLVVRSPAQLRERLTLNDWFLREIVEKGRVLYAATHHRMD
jgi:predicted nucleotidyltransferase